MDTRKWNKNRHSGTAVFSIAGWFFMAFVVGWVFLIPFAVAALLVYGYVAYSKERKYRIDVAIKPTEAMRALARREEELRREKERLLKEQVRFEAKR
ncbi:MAG TPA: hypothetical protein VIO11_02035 [Candidatus Methanoperedens sp.]